MINSLIKECPLSPMERATFTITGMDCAEEIAILKREVGPLFGGPDTLQFDLLQARMSVPGPLDSVLLAQVIRTVARSGMTASPVLPEAQAADPPSRVRGMLCALSGALLVAAYAAHAFTSGGLLAALQAGESGVRPPLLPTLLYAGAVLSGGWLVAPKAFFAARRLRPDMNLLMLIAVFGAIALGQWNEAATVTFLFAFSLVLESWSVGRARRAIQKLLDLAPQTARFSTVPGAAPQEAPIIAVPLDAIVSVRPGEKVPLDGVVTLGETTLNQAPITGESRPIHKAPGDSVFAGSINNEGAFEFRVTRPAGDTTLARIIRMVEQAQSRRARSEQWVERFAAVYTPAMLLVALLIALVPPLLFGGAWSHWIYEALVILVIACPCALVISTPVSMVAGLACAARNGVLIKGGIFLEIPARLRALAMDKTGTLTHGAPVVDRVVLLGALSEAEVLAGAAALEAHSTHPLARAILARAASFPAAPAAQSVRQLAGRGIEGLIADRPFWLGSLRLARERSAADPALERHAAELEDAGHSLLILGEGSTPLALIALADQVRASAAPVVAELKHLGVQTVMFTGDNEATAQAVAAQVGIVRVHAGLLPEDKARLAHDLAHEHGHGHGKNRGGAVGMVGDGVNDAPALASVDLGIAMGAMGSDAAIETADIALMTDDLTKLPWLIRHSRRTLRIIQQNIAFALGVKLIFMFLALTGHATLWLAIAADTGASLIVIANALRLLRAPASQAPPQP